MQGKADAPSTVALPTLLSAESVEKANAKKAGSIGSHRTPSEHKGSSDNSVTVAELPADPGSTDTPEHAAHVDDSVHTHLTSDPATAAAHDTMTQSQPDGAEHLRPQPGQATSGSQHLPGPAGLRKSSSPDQVMRA
jgi:hypothetical protein